MTLINELKINFLKAQQAKYRAMKTYASSMADVDVALSNANKAKADLDLAQTDMLIAYGNLFMAQVNKGGKR